MSLDPSALRAHSPDRRCLYAKADPSEARHPEKAAKVLKDFLARNGVDWDGKTPFAFGPEEVNGPIANQFVQGFSQLPYMPGGKGLTTDSAITAPDFSNPMDPNNCSRT